MVLPSRTDPSCVPEVLAKHSCWIEKQFRRLPAMQQRTPSALPNVLRLKGGQEEIHILYAGDGLAPAATSEPESVAPSYLPLPPPVRSDLILRGESRRAHFHKLRQLVRENARDWLGNILAAMAAEHGFSYNSMRVRFQRTRWGSCSAKGSINLNAALLFLPERLVRYILLHELCHTRELNHSPAFWKLVFAADPDALAKDKAMRGAWKYVPDWLYAQE